MIGWLKADRLLRQKVFTLLMLFGAATFCAIGVDLFHTALPSFSVAAGLAGAAEEGGEMILMSAMVSYAVSTFWPRPRKVAPIPESPSS
ncbi:hypothetical protein [Paracoccus sp. (in: a-proteobacteria)]|uniref:hypothetical protein n=1 Tax=Paracoccus sp. TaxID=267 RepID=UPI003A873549